MFDFFRPKRVDAPVNNGPRCGLSNTELDQLAQQATAGIDRDLVAGWFEASTAQAQAWRPVRSCTLDPERGSLTVHFRDGDRVRVAIPADVSDVAEQFAALCHLETADCRVDAHGPLTVLSAVSETWQVTCAGTPAVSS